ncbi:MAG: amidohydrolase family protein [Bacteroidota bacterium]
MKHIINTHTHIFTFDHVPRKFLPFGLVRYLAKKRRSAKLARFLNSLWPLSDKDVLDRFASFVSQGYEKSQQDILESLIRFYPEGTQFVVLPMDMEYMGAGLPHIRYPEQMKDLLELKRKQQYAEILRPFVFAHPSRPGITEHVKEYIGEHGFSGIKIYPPLGYYPFDDRLDEVFAYAEEKQIPIMTHCSHPVVFYKGKIRKKMRIHPLTGELLKKEKNKKFADNWTHPDNYKEVLRKFPELKICFGHFGGSSEWIKYYGHTSEEAYKSSWFYQIKKLILQHPNVYADVSYALSDEALLPMLKLLLTDPKLSNKILFGSDFYMARIEGQEFKFSIALRAAIGEDNFKRIAVDNPRVYLGMKGI